EEGEKSLAYLWDIFGNHGTWEAPEVSRATDKSFWRSAVLKGRPVLEEPRSRRNLAPEVYSLLLREAGGADGPAYHPPPTQLESVWRRVADDLLGEGSNAAPLQDLIRASVEEAGLRLARACWSETEGQPRATLITELGRRLFGRDDQVALEAVR